MSDELASFMGFQHPECIRPRANSAAEDTRLNESDHQIISTQGSAPGSSPVLIYRPQRSFRAAVRVGNVCPPLWR